MAETNAKITVFEGELEDTTLPAPQNVTAEYGNGEIITRWTERKPYQAKYMLFRINDVDLGYLPVSEHTGMIDGIEDIDNAVLKVAWLDKNFEVGEWAEVEIVRPEPEEINIEPVQTGIASPSTSLLAILIAITVVVVFLNKKYLPR